MKTLEHTISVETSESGNQTATNSYQSLAGNVLKFTPGPGKKSAEVLFTSRRGMKVVATPWARSPMMVRFPKAAGTLAGRRFYPDLASAKTAIAAYETGRTAASLGKKATDEYLYCASLLEGVGTLTEAVRFFIEHRGAGSKLTFGELKSYWLKSIEHLSDLYLKDCRLALKMAGESIKDDTPVRDLSRSVLVAVINKETTYWNRRRVFVALSSAFNRAVADGLFPSNPLTGYKLTDTRELKEITFLTPEETSRLLRWVKDNAPDYLPAFALQLFAGIRTEELSRAEGGGKRPLYWSDLTYGQRIEVPAAVSKTDTPRTIEFWPKVLTDWLGDRAPIDGPVVAATTYVTIKTKLAVRFQKEQEALGLPRIGWDQNVTRHTYATYLVAFFQSAARAAIYMGHRGEDMLGRHYNAGKALISQAEAYFGEKSPHSTQ